MFLAGNKGRGTALLCAALALLILFAVFASRARSAEPYTLVEDIAYAPANEQEGSNLLDIYRPRADSSRRRPVFVWIHGGGWFSGDKRNVNIAPKARALVRAGFVFVSINYRLSPDLDGPLAFSRDRLRYPTHVKDAARALGWIDRHIAAYGGSPNRLVIGGDSAGGQISSLLATRPAFLRARGVETTQIKGVLSLDAVGFNVRRMMTPAYKRISAGFQRMMWNAFGTPAEERETPRWDSASPIRFADPTDPPIFHVVPTSSPDRWAEARRMAKRLGQWFPVVSWRVDTNHPGVVPLLGAEDDMGVTARAIRFVKAAVSRERAVPVIRGRRTVKARGKAKAATVRLTIGSRPSARQVTCRIDSGRERVCPRSFNLRVGRHTLRVTAYGDTGSPIGSRSAIIRVRG